MAETPKKKSKWIKAGDKHPGKFADKAKAAGKSTAEFAAEKKDAGGALGKEANFAANAMSAAKKRRATLYSHPRSEKRRNG